MRWREIALAILLLMSSAPAHAAAACDVRAASPWIRRWLEAWDLTSREILHLPDAPPPHLILFDTTCVYTTSEVTAPGARVQDGPALRGTALAWRAAPLGDSLTLPNHRKVAVGLLSFTNNDKSSGPFFVMAGPDVWSQHGIKADSGLTAVFLHEFSHTRQLPGMARIIGPIDSTWTFPEELDDDVVQTHFGKDSVYVAAYRAERDLLYRAAYTASMDSVRLLARQALELMRARQRRWFTGEYAAFAQLDNTFLSMEGAGQWAGYAWLADARGGGLSKQAADNKISGRRRHWSQDEGLGLYLVIDRLLPDWPKLVFHNPSMGAADLLETALRR